jgi:hypothetical protein
MRGTKVRGTMFLAVAVAVMMAFVASAAVGAPAQTVTTRSITSVAGSLTIAVESTGNAGATHGNVNYWTSPVDASGDFEWFNQSVRVTDFALADFGGDPTPTFAGATFARNTGSGYSEQVALPAPYILADEGVYSIIATGTDPGDVTGTIVPALGIDKTDPVVTTDRVAFYTGAPTVTVAATDTMSGVENVSFNVNGAFNDSWEPDPSDPSTFSVSFPFVGDGEHTFSWTAFDNAGNSTHGSETFVVDNTAPTTTSDLVSDYNGAATINLTAVDNVGGSGVAHTYYIVDSGSQTEGTTIHVAAPVDGSATHTVEFWSVDALGNTETPHVTGTITVNSQHTVTVTAPAHGTITPGTAVVNLGADSAVYAISPSTGYHIQNVFVDGVGIGAVSSYQFTNVTANHTLTATFAINTYRIVPSRSNTHGSITPRFTQTVNYGGSKRFTMKAARLYRISKVLVDGRNVGARSSWTFTNVRGGHSIRVYFVHR